MIQRPPRCTRTDTLLPYTTLFRARVLHIGGTGAPAIGVGAGHLDRLPLLVALIDIVIARAEHAGIDRRMDQVLHFLVGRPDVLQIDGLTVLPGADRLLGEVGRASCRERVCQYG